jgi:hypothetical protein
VWGRALSMHEKTVCRITYTYVDEKRKDRLSLLTLVVVIEIDTEHQVVKRENALTLVVARYECMCERAR